MTHLVRRGQLPILPLDDRIDDDDNRASPKGLAEALANAIEGEVRFDAASRALYATDGSNYRHVPIGVVRPKSVDDVLAVIDVCRRFDVPVLPRGGGTSLAGQCCNVAVVVDMTKYLRGILAIDVDNKLVRVEPGCVLDDLNRALEPHALMFAPDPSTHGHCALGGMIGNNSCGVHSVMAGRTADNVRSLDVVTYDGLRMKVGRTSDAELRAILDEGGRRAEIYAALATLRDEYGHLVRERYPDIPRRVSGYNLDELLPERGFNVARALVGSEGTCVTVLEAELEVVHRPPERAMIVLGYESVYEAADHIDEVMAEGPMGLEGLDRKLVEHAKKKHLHEDAMSELPEGDGWLVVEFGGETKDEARNKAERLARVIRSDARIGRKGGAMSGKRPSVRIYVDKEDQKKVWEVREAGLGSTARVPGEHDAWEGFEDAAVPPSKLGLYLRDFRRLLQRYDYDTALYGHFGQGCIHCRINFALESRDGVQKWRAFLDEAADLVVSYGGSISGEHGDGQSRAELLPKMFGPELIEAFRRFKSIWDPARKMNPGKIVDARPITADLRVGPDHHPWDPPTKFHYDSEDHGSFARAMNRCVGVGKCRDEKSGTMCPSWRATHEEEHSTRGRARLLWEMLDGEVIRDGWRDDGVKEALDLCLACKGCKHDCPVNVDMASYKSEFLAHYHEAHRRPRQAYAFGYIDVWSKLAEIAPGLVNAFSQHAPFDVVAKWIAGVHPARAIPKFAKHTFRRDFIESVQQGTQSASSVQRRRDGEQLVLLWPDTFNDHFFPNILHSAANVLDACGFVVDIPRARVCCGRPVYDFGMIDRGRRLLAHTLDVLGPYIDARVPVVFAEPSCMAVFLDELPALFPNNERAKALSQSCYSLSEFIEQRAPHAIPRVLDGTRAVVHGHCHEKALKKKNLGLTANALKRTGLDVDALPSGCCGLAGSFGFERDKYDVSMAVADGDLFPKLRANAGALVVADGFSCREQVRMGMHIEPLHSAEVFERAVNEAKARALLPEAMTATSARKVLADLRERWEREREAAERG